MNRDALIAAMHATAAAPPRKIPVPGWGDVYVKALTVEQVDLQQQEPAVEGKDRLRFARGAARMLCDENGVLLFDAENKDDLELLAKQPWESLKAIMVAGGDESATTEAGSETAKKA
jgi:hypothetical protein